MALIDYNYYFEFGFTTLNIVEGGNCRINDEARLQTLLFRVKVVQ